MGHVLPRHRAGERCAACVILLSLRDRRYRFFGSNGTPDGRNLRSILNHTVAAEMAGRFWARACRCRRIERVEFGASQANFSHSIDPIPQFHLADIRRVQIAEYRRFNQQRHISYAKNNRIYARVTRRRHRRSPELKTLLTGLAMGESPRWHDDRLWFCDWGAQEIVAVDLDGNSEVAVRTQFGLPFCIDWLPDGRLLIVSGRENLLMRQEADGSLVIHADLRSVSNQWCNEIVVDGRGNAYINGGPGIIALVPVDCSVRQVADGIAFPNGMAVTPDKGTLIVAESHGKRLTAFDIASDGTLSNRHVWADLGDGAPDGICLDADGAVWYADVPNKRCVRVREGGEVVQIVNVDRGCFACMLGGAHKKTLFIIATEWRGMDAMPEVARARTGKVLTIEASAPHAGWP